MTEMSAALPAWSRPWRHRDALIGEARQRQRRRRWRIAAVLGATAAAVGVYAFTQRGSSTPPASPIPLATRIAQQHATQMASRLKAADYTVHYDVAFRAILKARPLPLSAFSVKDVDWATVHSFSTAVYVFSSRHDATRFAHSLISTIPQVAVSHNRSFEAQHHVDTIGTDVFASFTEMDPLVCANFGICADYQSYGSQPACTLARRCVGGPQPLNRTDVSKLIRTAERK